jgi:DNA primase
MYDIISFLIDNDIDYYEQGKNISSEFIGIDCPFCGDTSGHGGIHREKQFYSCWKCGGNRLSNVFTEILNINYYEYKKLINKYILEDYIPEIEERPYENNNNIITLPGGKLDKKHRDYLVSRNFDPDYLEYKYRLKGTLYLDGKWNHRIIIPIYYNNRLVSFTSRAIYDNMEPRYLTLAKRDEVICHKNILYNLKNCKKDSIILITEGLLDVMRIGDNTTCTFGTSVTSSQLQILSKYSRIFILFDPELQAQKKALKLANNLSILGTEVINLNIPEIEDPGSMSEEQVKYLKEELNI